MINFSRLKDNVNIIKGYLEQSENAFCDISIGVKYMWRDEYVIDYAIIEDTLIMKESSTEYNDVFYYPMGKNVDLALREIEEYCKTNSIPLIFGCVENAVVIKLRNLYDDVKVQSERNWDDYIYDAEKFKNYSGKKYSGQRNHVNKFKRLYPNYTVNVLTEQDYPKIEKFLKEFERGTDFSIWTEKSEQEKVYDYVKNADKLKQVGAFIEIDGKVIAFSMGEVINDTLIVHVEKGLKTYEGVYPTMAQEFAKLFAGSGIKYINREEDCGDMGLRTSKLQYHPIEIRQKNTVTVNTLFDKIVPPVKINAGELTVEDITENFKQAYFDLYTDDDLNKWWGYDYREDLGDKEITPDYFISFMKSLKEKKEEYSFAVTLNGEMIGELVAHNFGYYADVEIGFRFFKEFQGKGYARKSTTVLIEFLKTLGAKIIKSRCFKENIPSRRLIESLGLTLTHQTDTHYFFAKK
ncbi:MAG: GNAT family N-acetyltransferase [Clostridia bacterium]|nr:GNAT family N-acetyltransferase [Clostridia bacterium]